MYSEIKKGGKNYGNVGKRINEHKNWWHKENQGDFRKNKGGRSKWKIKSGELIGKK